MEETAAGAPGALPLVEEPAHGLGFVSLVPQCLVFITEIAGRGEF
jgi:hypothetical protein